MQTLDKALDVVMEFPLETRVSLIEILKKRTVEDIRSRIADNAKKARVAFHKGELPIGSVEDFLKSIRDEDELQRS
ncbi:conserved hypothetical protein [Candidatus Magnetomoraceae bacterium gMMP-15]